MTPEAQQSISTSPPRALNGASRSKLGLSGWLLLTFAIAGLVIAVLFSIPSVTRPYVGVDLSLQGDSWAVQWVDVSGLAKDAGIVVGERVQAVNGVLSEDLRTGDTIIRARDIRSLEVVSAGGITKSVDASSSPIPAAQLTESVLYCFIGLAFWLIAGIAYVKKPASAAVRGLFLLGVFVAIGLPATSAQERGVIFAVQAEFASLLAIGPLFASFFLMFPSSRWQTRWTSCLVYLPSLSALVLFLVMHGEAHTDFWSRVIVLPILSIGLLVGLVSLVHSSIGAGYVRARQQARIVMVGSFVGVVPFLLLSVFPYMAAEQTPIAPQFSIVALVALPASIAYALVRHRLFDIDLFIRRSLVYGLLSLVMAGAYVGVAWVTAAALGDVNGMLRIVAIIVIGAVGLITFNPVRNSVQGTIDRRFYRDRHDYREVLKSTSSSLSRMTDQGEISHFITASASELLGLAGACLLLYTKQGYLYARDAVGAYADAREHAGLVGRAASLKEPAAFPNMAPESYGAAFFVPLQAGGRQIGILCLGVKASREHFSVDDISFLHTFSTQAAAALENARLFAEASEHRVELRRAYEQLQDSAEELSRKKKELEEAYLGMARTLVLTLESRDPYTRGHSERVSRLVQRMAPGLGIVGEALQKLELAARLHDIGKTGVADAILLKPGAYDPSERAEIERHPTRGVEILRFLDFLKDVLPVIESHHEWYNGSGYPRGLKGEEIPLGGRILAVADAYDAMVSKRPHRDALPHGEAVRRLRDGSGTQWDPRIIEVFINSEGPARV